MSCRCKSNANRCVKAMCSAPFAAASSNESPVVTRNRPHCHANVDQLRLILGERLLTLQPLPRMAICHLDALTPGCDRWALREVGSAVLGCYGLNWLGRACAARLGRQPGRLGPAFQVHQTGLGASLNELQHKRFFSPSSTSTQGSRWPALSSATPFAALRVL